jgi:UPF0271 protein
MSNPLRAIDLNVDLGEGFSNDPALLAMVTSASVSCGAHAGDRETILATLREARVRSVQVGAHPGFADRAQFGRREMVVSAEEVEHLIRSQFDQLATIADELGVPLCFVKPHGALFNQAQREEEVAEGVVLAMGRIGLPVLGQPGGMLEAQARTRGVRFIAVKAHQEPDSSP